MRHAFAVLGATLLLATSCSGAGGGDRGAAGGSTTEALPTSATSTTGAVVTSTAAVASSTTATTRAGIPSTTAPPSPATVPPAAGPAAAEAGGWRLAITHPAARATIPPAAALCYEATGSSREPDLVLEVTALPPGTVSRVPITVGRGTARVDLSAAGVGARELRIEMIPDGVRVAGLSVTVPVTIAAGAAAGTC